MSVLIRDSRTGIVTSTDLIGDYLDLFLRQNPNYSLVGIAVTDNAIYYPLLNDTTLRFNDPFVQNTFVINPGLPGVGIGTTNPRATLDVVGGVNIDNLQVGFLTVTKRLDVGVGGTVLRASADTGFVGIGTTQPQQKLDVAGSVKIDENIYDSVNVPGRNGYQLSRDINGIRWIPLIADGASPGVGFGTILGLSIYSEGIFILDEGVPLYPE